MLWPCLICNQPSSTLRAPTTKRHTLGRSPQQGVVTRRVGEMRNLKSLLATFSVIASLGSLSSGAIAAPTYSLRLFNTDDQLNAYVNGSSTPVLQNAFLGDTGFV